MDPRKVRFFISSVRDTPQLWQHFQKAQCSEGYLQKTWEGIGSCMDPRMTGVEAALNFKTLENIFHECNKVMKSTERSGTSASSIFTPQWEYYNDLCFLNDQRPPRRTMSNITEGERMKVDDTLGIKKEGKDPCFIEEEVNLDGSDKESNAEGEKRNIGSHRYEEEKETKSLKETNVNVIDVNKSESRTRITVSKPQEALTQKSSTFSSAAHCYEPVPGTSGILKYSLDLTQSSSESENSDNDDIPWKLPLSIIQNTNQFDQLTEKNSKTSIPREFHCKKEGSMIEDPLVDDYDTKLLNCFFKSGKPPAKRSVVTPSPGAKKPRIDTETDKPLAYIMKNTIDNTPKILESLSPYGSSKLTGKKNETSSLIPTLIFALNEVPQHYQLQCVLQMLKMFIVSVKREHKSCDFSALKSAGKQ